MKLRDRSWFAVSTTTLALLAACGPSVSIGDTEGDSEGSTGATTGTTNPDPTRPMTTTPDPSVGTGDVTGQATTEPPVTTGPDDTTGGGSDNCCEVHPTPGCAEEAVVECVCAQEAFCCAFEWDQNCVDLAMGDCMATCEDPGTTTDEPETSSSTGEPVGGCEELLQFEMFPADATHSGAWELSPSMVLPYEISLLNEMLGEDGSILYEPDIPCDDTWYVWVLYWEQGQDDSYFATLDGEPMPEAIFEGDCTGFGQGYSWRLLNWRDQGAMACDYVADPWAPDWTAGVHQIEFSFRESPAMGQILITNDPDFVPM